MNLHDDGVLIYLFIYELQLTSDIFFNPHKH